MFSVERPNKEEWNCQHDIIVCSIWEKKKIIGILPASERQKISKKSAVICCSFGIPACWRWEKWRFFSDVIFLSCNFFLCSRIQGIRTLLSSDGKKYSVKISPKKKLRIIHSILFLHFYKMFSIEKYFLHFHCQGHVKNLQLLRSSL